ncbi:MAG: GNAT family N-acetyltransferase [Devosia sp.]|uniref:GNAT family N-acetyltransferase n=1 Tax=Devosia sp. 66-22 TaxID=1895753 RepID=UPI000A451DD0|nr:GNAT family N-acetyltransferase [Devosia sp. 66-22]MBN9345839.1 GNAT family N-acetyltransferase [Devosia sp.]
MPIVVPGLPGLSASHPANPGSILIRPVHPSERGAFIGMALRSWRDAYLGLLPQADIDDAPAMMARAWDKRQAAFRVAVADGVIAGFYSLGEAGHPTDANYLWHLYVDPMLQRRGIGRALNAAALDEVASRGATAAWLDVHAANGKARAFYRALGWRDAGPDPDDPDLVRMDIALEPKQ